MMFLHQEIWKGKFDWISNLFIVCKRNNMSKKSNFDSENKTQERFDGEAAMHNLLPQFHFKKNSKFIPLLQKSLLIQS